MHRRRLCAILVILVLSLSMFLPAFAEGNHIESFMLTPEEEAYLQTIKGDTLSLAATSELLYFEGADKVREGILLPLNLSVPITVHLLNGDLNTWYMVLSTVFAVVAVVFMLFFLYQMRKFALYDSQIRHMLSVQNDVDMIWVNVNKKKIESKGNFPLLRRYGAQMDQELYDQLMEMFIEDLKNINTEGVEFRRTEAIMYLKGQENPLYTRRYTAKISEREIMSFILDVTTEKEREKELNRIANTDYLSQLMTRRATEKHLLRLVAALGNFDKQLFVLMFDIDNFKQVNDNYGHDIGDRVLVQLARILRKYMGANNTGRWGGEEFLATLYRDNMGAAIEAAGNVLHEFAQTEFKVGSRTTFHCTVSCGVARIISDMEYSQGIQFADKALYEAKRSGKNCIRAYCPEHVPSTALRN